MMFVMSDQYVSVMMARVLFEWNEYLVWRCCQSRERQDAFIPFGTMVDEVLSKTRISYRNQIYTTREGFSAE